MSQLLNQVNSLVPAIKEVILLAKEYEQSRMRFNKEEEPSKIGSFENYEKYLKDPEIIRTTDNLSEYLNVLSYDEVIIIESIMYIGRDEKDPEAYERFRREIEEECGYFDEPEDGVFDSPQKKIFDYLKYLKGVSKTKALSIETMLEKSPLADYLKRGLKILELDRS